MATPEGVTPMVEPGLTMQDYWESLTKPEKDYAKAFITRLSAIRDQRETAIKEFDNLTYSQRYEINKQADIGYNSLVGDIDERDKFFSMRTGAVRQKDTSILSHLLGYEFEPAINAYDKHNRLAVELGENTADLVKRSREIEHYGDKRQGMYRELIAQGNVFAEEEYIQKFMFQKDAKNEDGQDWLPGQKISTYKGDDMPIVNVQEDCETNLILGKYVYMASRTQEDIQKQSLVATYREISLGEFNRIYGSWDRAEYVRATVRNGVRYQDNISQLFNVGDPNTAGSGGTWGSQYFWNMQNPGKNVGLVKVYEPFSNRYMLLANGVMMLPIDFPLTKVSPSGLIPMAKGDAEKIQGFSYAKGIPSNTFVDEKAYDFVYQSMLKKMLQSAEPTLANNTGRELPRNWARPGLAYRGLKASMIEPLLPIDARTITNSEVQFTEIVKGILSDKSVDSAFTGGDENSDGTATVYLEQQKNTISKLFALVDGVKSFERQLVRLRIANIYANWTKHEAQVIQEEVIKITDGIPEIVGVKHGESKTYRQETIDTKVGHDKQDGTKVIRFHDLPELPGKQEHYDEEEELTKLYGKPVRVVYMHAPSLQRLFDWTYRIDIVPRDTTAGSAEMLAYLDAKQRIANLFATDPSGVINKDYTLGRVAEFQDEDPNKAYNIGDNAPQPPPMPMPGAPGDPNAQAAQGGQGVGGKMGAGQVPSPIGQAVNAMQPGLK